jgi:hypothetical protein
MAAGVREAREEKFLYHYTAVGTAEKIVRGRSLWATNIYYLNDGHEFTHGVAMMRNHLSSAAALSQRARVFRDEAEWAALDSPKMVAFVVSFSEAGDLLSQWRSYCPPNRGVSLGFEPHILQSAAEAQGFRLLRCSYNVRQQQLTMRRVANAARTAFSKASTDGERAAVVTQFAETFARTAASFKDESFREEKEWRLVYIGDRGATKIEYREGISTLVPYITFHLPVDNRERLRLRRIILGPTPHANLALSAVKDMVKDNNVLWGAVDNSSTPFRAW